MVARSVQLAYYSLNMAGGLGLLPLLLMTTVVSRKLKKQPVLINMYCAFSLEAALACLLFFAKKYTLFHGSVANQRIADGSALCVVQAILFVPSPVLLAGATFSVVLHIFLIIRSIRSSESLATSPAYSYLLIIFPYIAYIAVMIPIMIVAIHNPSETSPHQLYCILNRNFASLLSGIVTAVIAVCAILLQVWTTVLLRRDHKQMLSRTSLDISLVLRVLLFTVFMLLTVILSAATATDFTAIVPDIIVSTAPLVVFLIFGSRQDTLNALRIIFTQSPAITIKDWLNPSTHSHSGSRHDTSLQLQTMSRTKTSRTRASMSIGNHRTEVAKDAYGPMGSLPVTRSGGNSSSAGRLRAREMESSSAGYNHDFLDFMESSRIPGTNRAFDGDDSNLPRGVYLGNSPNGAPARGPQRKRPQMRDDLDFDSDGDSIVKSNDHDLEQGGGTKGGESLESHLPPSSRRPTQTRTRSSSPEFEMMSTTPGSERSAVRTRDGRASSIIDIVSSLSSINPQSQHHHTISFQLDEHERDRDGRGARGKDSDPRR